MRLPVLPDCALLAPPTGLSARQRRELVRLLAEEGPGALEAWLRREEGRDPTIRGRLEAERVRLEREARAQRRRLQDAHAEEERTEESAWERRVREMHGREEALRQRLETVRAAPLLTREDLVAGSPLYRALLEGEGRRRTPLRRARDALRRLWILVVSLWVRFVRWLTGRRAPVPRTVVTLPAGAPVDLARGLGPDALVGLQEQGAGWRERMRRAWDRLLGREDYAEEVQRLMEEERRRLEEKRRREREAEERRIQEELRQAEGQAEEAEGDHEVRRRERRRRHEEALQDLGRRQQEAPYEALRRGLLGELEAMGLVDDEGRATERLLLRFSRMIYEETRQALPAGGQTVPGTYVEGEGEYEMGPLRSQHETGAMDLVASVVHARLHHPHVRHIFDEDILVHREVRSATAHVVLVFDTSGSMEQGGRLDAAKRVCLVLHQAVKERNPDHRFDLLRMHTSVERVDLAACWDSEPHGFTNHAAALRDARRLFEAEGADRKVLYLVTDGLPEAYTKPDGTDKADRPDICMEHALDEARRLRALDGLRVLVLQLETEDPLFLEAAGDIARAAGGRVEGLPPERLAEWVLGDFQTTPLGPPSGTAV